MILEAQSTLLKDEPGIVMRAHNVRGRQIYVITHVIKARRATEPRFGTVESCMGATGGVVAMVNMIIKPA